MVELRLLASFEITDTQRRPVSSVLAQPKRAALLAYLAIATPRGFHRRDKLLALFWPEADAAHARHALNQAIHHLRAGVGSELIVTRGFEDVALDETRFRCDVTDMRDCLVSGRLDEALEIYRAELLPGFHVDASVEFDDWLEQERRALHESAVEAAISLATHSEYECNLPAALIWARRACALAPSDEACARQLIRCLMRDGNHAAAHAEYERLATLLKREFDAAPSAKTADLLDPIEAGADRRMDAAPAPLLRFTDGFPRGGIFEAARSIFALGMLQESRIAEALGDAQEAVRFASIFISACDLAPPSQRSLIEEARLRIARLKPRIGAPASE